MGEWSLFRFRSDECPPSCNLFFPSGLMKEVIEDVLMRLIFGRKIPCFAVQFLCAPPLQFFDDTGDLLQVKCRIRYRAVADFFNLLLICWGTGSPSSDSDFLADFLTRLSLF